ncbi:cellulose synthase [Tianweitania sp.]|uniref:cellulose synthase n=1 Tax=Tianweitania sp. TaxID=2021634 RepID=UPI00289D4010|nr:cellulose synthase [Tianweitania sp.]
MKTAIVATAILTSLSTTALLQVRDSMRESPQISFPPAPAPLVDFRSTGSVPPAAVQSDKDDRLGLTSPGKSDRLSGLPVKHVRSTSFFAAYASEAPEDQSILLAQADTSPNGSVPAPAVPAPAVAARPAIDESALRYFARQGDQRRLDAEIARLRALYPDWTPPADPLAVPNVGDPQLDAMWQLYSQGKYAEMRKAIADRQTADPSWQVPADMLERLSVAEARERLINASDLKQYETVVRTAAETPSLLTCAEVDVLWRLAEAFAKTERPERARDAYKYVLDSCTDPAQRLATVEKAIPLLPKPLVDQLLATERTGPDGKGEFQEARLALSRQTVANAGQDPKLVVPPADLNAVKAVAEPDTGNASDPRLLGWYYIRRDQPQDAELWFSKSRDREESAEASQGLALAKIALNKPGEAEDILYKYRDENDDIRKVYMAAAANFLASEPRVAIDPAILARMAQETAETRDPAAAQQFGWYARDLNQHQTAAQWFTTALQWKPDDEPSAYGLVLTRNLLGDKAGVREIQRLWAGHSTRIANLGEPVEQTQANRRIPAPTDAPLTGPASAPLTASTTAPQATISAYTGPATQTATATGAYSAAPLQGPTGANIAMSDRMAPADVNDANRGAAIQEAYTTTRTRNAAVASAEPRQNAGSRSGGRAPQGRNCSTTDQYTELTGQAALARAWCLSEMNRPLEAAATFEQAIRTGNAAVQREAAYGQSLAYLSRNMVDDAALSASKAAQDPKRSHQLEVDILTQRALGFYEQKRYNEALLALDQRSRIATERVDLMAIRGYAYLNLKRLGDAERVFNAMAAVGSKEGYKGLATIRDVRRLP